MKNERGYPLCFGAVILGALCVTNAAQGTFLNGDFESATVPVAPAPGGAVVLTVDALPGWTAYSGVNLDPVNQLRYNQVVLGYAGLMLYGPGWRDSSDILTGRFSLYLGSFPGVSTVVAQTVQIPDDSKSLIFYSKEPGINITFGGESLPYFRIGTSESYDAFGTDISAFAGQTGELRFTANGLSGALLDDIRFSTVAVPEPGTVSLVVTGIAVLCWKAFRRVK